MTSLALPCATLRESPDQIEELRVEGEKSDMVTFLFLIVLGFLVAARDSFIGAEMERMPVVVRAINRVLFRGKHGAQP